MNATTKRMEVSAETSIEREHPRPAARFHPYLEQGHRLALAYIGLWGVLYDQTGELYQSGERLFKAAIERGEQMEEALYRALGRWSRCIPQRRESFQRQVEADLQRAAGPVHEAGENFEEQLERQVERVLARLGIPTRERLAKLNREIERLNAILDEKLAQREAVHT